MTTKSKKVKFTLYMTEQLSKLVEEKADELGLSKNAYIITTLNKAIKENK